MKMDKEKTIQAILRRESPFCSIDEAGLRKKAAATGGIAFLRKAAKFVKAEVVNKPYTRT